MLLLPQRRLIVPAAAAVAFAPAYDDWEIKDFGASGAAGVETFSGLTVTATGDVLVCISATLFDATAISGVTIGGNTVTLIASASDSSRIIWVGRASMVGATGDDVVVTTDAGTTNVFYERSCTVVDIDGAAASETDSAAVVAAESTSASDVSVDTALDDAVIAFWHGYRFDGGVDVTWVGATSVQEDNGSTISSTAIQCAIATEVAAATPRTVTATPVSTQSRMCAAVSIGAA